MAESRRQSAKRPATKRAATRSVSKRSDVPEKDWVDEMNETLAKVAETARRANAAELTAENGATPASGSRWWPHRLRGSRA
ncbi:MAG TPA: hypothetical protein VFU26_13620 [Gaiellaceae bacterium]|nr:hypothetical protein [Gaiellaceae bacterium]